MLAGVFRFVCCNGLVCGNVAEDIRIPHKGDEITVELPARMEVCDECEGHGTVLCEGLRGVAYTSEEFEERFAEEGRCEYLRHGGRYDVACPQCHGRNVVPIVDEDSLTDDQRRMHQVFCDIEAERALDERVRAAERRMGA